MPPLLRCDDLSVRFNVRGGVIDAVSNVHLAVSRGECLGVLGESGSGKSQCFLAIMGLLSGNGSASGSVSFDGQEILNAPRKALDRIRSQKTKVCDYDMCRRADITVISRGDPTEMEAWAERILRIAKGIRND